MSLIGWTNVFALAVLCAITSNAEGFQIGTRLNEGRATSIHINQRIKSTCKSESSLFIQSQFALQQHQASQDEETSSGYRFLGRGKDAIVRLGCVLVSPAEEFHHFLRESAVFIYSMGYDVNDVYVIRGVIIDHPTPFTMDEMIAQNELPPTSLNDDIDNISDDADESVSSFSVLRNPIFRGGDLGDGASVAMFHSDTELANSCDLPMIGTSGIYQGGLESALQSSSSPSTSNLDPNRCKFFFHYMEFTEMELENLLNDPQGDGDSWSSIEVPTDVILESDYDRGEAWARLRNKIKTLEEQES